MREITSVFKEPMGEDSLFNFKILQSTGGNSKRLMIPSVSPGYKWTASAVAGKNAKVPIYILAKDRLKVRHCSGFFFSPLVARHFK